MARAVTLFTGQWADLPLEELAPKAKEFGYDGLELACWGDHFEVDKALEDDNYCQSRWDILEKNGLSKAIMIDASHDNSKKDHRLQPGVFRDVIDQRVNGNEWLVAAMLESNLEAGNQSLVHPLSDLRYGQSITDKCIDWDTTVQVVKEAYDQLG